MNPVRPTRKAKARLEDIEPREVSPVDRPANAEPFLIVKSEGGAGEEQMAGKTTTQKTGGLPPDQAQMAAGGAPPPPMAEEQKAPGDMPLAEEMAESGEVTMVLPMGAKSVLVNALKGAQGRIGQLVMMLEKATEAEGVEMPSEPIVAIADAAGAMGMAIEPYVSKQAGAGMAAPPPPAEGDAEVGKAAFVPWTREYIDSLPDCAFLHVEAGTERDNEWRTIPLSLRHFPVRDHAYRLCLPMVVEAIGQITSGAAPFLSPQKKRRLLLRLASDRLYEVSIAAERDEPMTPETTAELLAVAEMIAMVGGMTPAAPAPLATPAPTEGETAPPMGETSVEQVAPPGPEMQMAAFAKAVNGRIQQIAEIGKAAPRAGAHALVEMVSTLKSMLVKVESLSGGAVETTKSAPDDVEKLTAEAVAKAVAEKDAELASTKDELSKSRVELDKTRADLSAVKTQLAKAERRTPPSNVGGDEREDVTKATTAYLPPSRDLNADFDREKQQRSRA